MSDDIWKRNEVESPCIKQCAIHPTAGICTGCLRSLEEIGGWSMMTPENRREIMQALPERAALLRVRRGGRRARLGN